MKENDIQKILEIVIDKIKGKNIVRRLEGSANLRIQGVDVLVNDLDITTNDEGIRIFRESLQDYIVKDFFSEKINGYSLVCDINGFEVEINFYGDRKLNMFEKTTQFSWHDLIVPVLPLRDAQKFYELIDRKDKVDLISRYL